MRCWLVLIIVALLTSAGEAQHRGSGISTFSSLTTVQVHVVLANDRSAGRSLTVRLMRGSTDAVLGTAYTNDSGEADFSDLPAGDYHVQVSGDSIQPTNGETFSVGRHTTTETQYVTVRRTEDAAHKSLSAQSGMVSANDLKVPPEARKELDKANEAIAKQDWKKAKEHLDKALAIEPHYAAAYNSLAVLYASTNDVADEEKALEQATALDDHFAPALLNYGKLCIQQKNYAHAEELLLKEVAADPADAESLTLLAIAQLMNGHLEAATTSAARAHSSSHDHPAVVHYIAAMAYEQQNQPRRALSELQTFIQEEPQGPRAEQARADMAKLQSESKQSPAAPQTP